VNICSNKLSGLGALALLSILAVAPAADAAPIEGAQNAPDPLQYPGVTAVNAVTGSSLPVALLRNATLRGALSSRSRSPVRTATSRSPGRRSLGAR